MLILVAQPAFDTCSSMPIYTNYNQVIRKSLVSNAKVIPLVGASSDIFTSPSSAIYFYDISTALQRALIAKRGEHDDKPHPNIPNFLPQEYNIAYADIAV
jgi:hypothetical protein